MSLRITVRNFQSIEHAELQVEGLTALVGPNNCGKSAIYRAVHGVFANARGTAFVRHGAPFATVRIDFPDGRYVQWEKGAGVNRYTLDGKVLDKVGAGAPPELETLGFSPLTVGGVDLWPQFAPQFNGTVFLFDRPGSILAEAVSDVSRVGVLNEALRLAQSDKRSLQAEVKIRTGDLARLERDVVRYENLDDALRLLQMAEDARRSVETLSRRVIRLRELAARRRTLSSITTRLQSVRKVEIPSVPGTATLTRYVEVEKRRGARVRIQGLVRALRPIESAPEPRDTQRCAKILAGLERVRGLRNRRLECLRVDTRGAQAVEIPDVLSARDAYKRLSAVRELRNKRQVVTDMMSECLTTSLSLAADVDTVKSQISQVLTDSGSCPFCGREGDSSCQ